MPSKPTGPTPTTVTLPPYLADPVLALWVLPGGHYYELEALEGSHDRINRITVGRDRYCRIQLDDPSVSSMHCLLYRRYESRWFIEEWENKNPVYVNDAPLHRGSVEVLSGFVIRVGRSKLLACGRAGKAQIPCIASTGLDAHMKKMIELMGSQRRAAEILSVAQPTMNKWCNEGGRFEDRRLARNKARSRRTSKKVK